MKSAEKIEVLIVEDDPSCARFLALMLSNEKFHATIATSSNQAISLLKEKYFPIIVSDINLGCSNGLNLIPFTKAGSRPSLIIFVTGQASLDTAVKAIADGAFEYICKPDDLHEMKPDLLRIIDQALDHLKTLDNKTEAIVRSVEARSKSIIGKSPAMAKLYRMIAKAAQSAGNVLITGESGTGKELVAHAIHVNGPWSDKPFVTVNCGALTETLLESELFGHIKGSFTGALGNKTGLFEEANGGVIFLDEIGDISLSLQVKLLRAVQEGEIKPVGSAESRKVKVRVIAATHQNLELLIKQGLFREDLYYRLKVFIIDVPPLRERKQDIPDLVRYLMGRTALNRVHPLESISKDALKKLIAYSWPGNVRELENAIERAAGMASGSILFPQDFPPEIVSYRETKPELISTIAQDMSLDQLEAQHIERTLERVRYNKTRAAEILGIDRGTLYRKAIQYHISLKRVDEVSPQAKNA